MIKISFCHTSLQKATIIFLALFCRYQLSAQKQVSLSNLTDFKNAGANWHIAGDVNADLNKKDTLIYSDGTGILVNIPNASAKEDIYTNFKHGDLDIELDYMMAKGSNSGIYLQGRYEVQLLDSWGILNPRSGDNGGIYERWDDAKPEGQKGYEGYAPRQNVSRAPGLWQHLKIVFQAPRFKGSTKIENAKMLKVELNGVLIHENISLSGPTRAAVDNNEVATDALMIQGDHGPVALKNIVVSNFDKVKPSLSAVACTLYKGKFVKEPDYKTIKAIIQKTYPAITTGITGLPDNEYLVRYTGTLHINEPGEYNFTAHTDGGSGAVKINNTVVIALNSASNKGFVNLQTGDWPFEFIYSKYIDWAKSSMALNIAGPGIREFTISDAASISAAGEADPVLVNATENTILRSFTDLPAGGRISHAVNAGSTQKIHYTYDMEKGMLVQLWRGNFLDATPMWHERGDGSSKAAGAVEYFGKPVLTVQKLTDVNAVWAGDTTGTGYRPNGYVLDEKDRPTFKYTIYGVSVSDKIRALENGQGIDREITIQHGTPDLYVRLAAAGLITEISKDLYLVNDKSYYLKFDNVNGIKPLIREQNGQKEILVPFQNKINYTILF
jgi:Domain of Unknown Function (DUF1080)